MPGCEPFRKSTSQGESAVGAAPSLWREIPVSLEGADPSAPLPRFRFSLDDSLPALAARITEKGWATDAESNEALQLARAVIDTYHQSVGGFGAALT